MKKWSISLEVAVLACVLVMALSGCDTTGANAVNEEDIDLIVAGNNSFAFGLYKRLAKEEGNLFFSPFSISSALAMTYTGARGETARQMADTLHFRLPAERLHSTLSNLVRSFDIAGKDYQLSVANALWGQAGYQLRPEFLDITSKYYDASFKEVDYVDDMRREEARQGINKWVEERTNGKIKDLIKPGDLTRLTRLILTNAIYFKGEWELQFDPKNTKPMPFYISAKEKTDVPMMHQTARFNYMEDDQLQILEMPYTGDSLSMVILLPKSGHELAEIEGALNPENIQLWLSRLSKRETGVFMPQFKLEKSLLLNEGLQELGMLDAFNEDAADFSGITPDPDLYISKIVHKAFVEVNEEGTEAAAATGVIMGTKSVRVVEPPVFRADHPFIFMIRDIRSGCILFIGRLVDPRS